MTLTDKSSYSRHKRGEYNPQTGQYFWCYQNEGHQYWATPNAYAQLKTKSEAWRESHRERRLASMRARYVENREKVAIQNRRFLLEFPSLRLLEGARLRAKKRGLPFNLTVDDIPVPERCPVLGIKLQHGVEKVGDASPTVDRIIPSLGYVKGNVLVISFKANRIKAHASIDELVAVANFYTQIINRRAVI